MGTDELVLNYVNTVMMWQPDCCHTSYMKNACCRGGWQPVVEHAVLGAEDGGDTKSKRHGDGRFGTLVWMVFRLACLLQWVRSIRRAQSCDSVGSPDSCPLTPVVII